MKDEHVAGGTVKILGYAPGHPHRASKNYFKGGEMSVHGNGDQSPHSGHTVCTAG